MGWLKVFAQGLRALPLDTGLSPRLKGFYTIFPPAPPLRTQGFIPRLSPWRQGIHPKLRALPSSKGFYPQARGLAVGHRTFPSRAEGLRALPVSNGFYPQAQGLALGSRAFTLGFRAFPLAPSKGFYPQAQGLALGPRAFPPGLRALPMSKGFYPPRLRVFPMAPHARTQNFAPVQRLLPPGSGVSRRPQDFLLPG